MATGRKGWPRAQNAAGPTGTEAGTPAGPTPEEAAGEGGSGLTLPGLEQTDIQRQGRPRVSPGSGEHERPWAGPSGSCRVLGLQEQPEDSPTLPLRMQQRSSPFPGPPNICLQGSAGLSFDLILVEPKAALVAKSHMPPSLSHPAPPSPSPRFPGWALGKPASRGLSSEVTTTGPGVGRQDRLLGSTAAGEGERLTPSLPPLHQLRGRVSGLRWASPTQRDRGGVV